MLGRSLRSMSLYEYRIVGRVGVDIKNEVNKESCCYGGKEARLEVMSTG